MKLHVVPTRAEDGAELHLAALPFPSYQGTQAAIRSMLETRNGLGVRAELYTYGTAGYPWAPTFPLHRGPADSRVTLRSGPSWAKVAVDVRMGLALPSLISQVRAQLLIAHHVEAMSLACTTSAQPRVFFAHTDLGAELPSYASQRYAQVLGYAGAAVDRVLCSRADAIAAVSPALCDQLREHTGFNATYVPTPWRLPAPIRAAERARARLQLGLASDTPVALYCGNLDGYQDAEQTLEALQQLATSGGPRVTLLLATRSEPQHFLERAVALGVPFRTYELGGEPVRRMVHAAADLAIVPRAVPGGLPIKLIDALARGLPCALTPLAAAGLPLSRVAMCADVQGPSALARAIAAIATQPGLRHTLRDRGRDHVASEHSPQRFSRALDEVAAQARDHFARKRRHSTGWNWELR